MIYLLSLVPKSLRQKIHIPEFWPYPLKPSPVENGFVRGGVGARHCLPWYLSWFTFHCCVQLEPLCQQEESHVLSFSVWRHLGAIFQTNTFQCILTTDGVRSFAMLRYGDMHWVPGQRIHHNALIGYTDGRNHFHNETTIPPDNLFGPAGRYRPQHVNGTLGKAGQLVYDLTGSPGADSDPRMRCQAWAMKEPDPVEWASGVSSCPCTRAQALEDLAFGPEMVPSEQGSRVRELRELRWGGTSGHVFQSILTNRHGSGKRCVYDPQGPLQAGYSERYFSGYTAQKHIGNTSQSELSV